MAGPANIDLKRQRMVLTPLPGRNGNCGWQGGPYGAPSLPPAYGSPTLTGTKGLDTTLGLTVNSAGIQIVPSGVMTPLTDLTVVLVNDFNSGATFASLFIAPVVGWYQIEGAYANPTNGYLVDGGYSSTGSSTTPDLLQIQYNGALLPSPFDQYVSRLMYLAVGDRIALAATQSTGAAQPTLTSSFLTIVRLP